MASSTPVGQTINSLPAATTLAPTDLALIVQPGEARPSLGALSDIVTAGLGFTPISTAGGAFSGAIQAVNVTATNEIAIASSGNGVDQNRSDSYQAGATLVFRLLNDAGSAANDWLEVGRSGYTPTSVTFRAPTSINADTTGDFGLVNQFQFQISSPGGGNAVIELISQGKLATKIGLDPTQGFVVGGFSLPANAMIVDGGGGLHANYGFTSIGTTNVNLLQFDASTASKINLFANSYGIGISPGDFQLFSGGRWSFRDNAYNGNEVASIDASGNLAVAGTISGVIDAGLY